MKHIYQPKSYLRLNWLGNIYFKDSENKQVR